ncbi:MULTISPECIES: anthranilate phosphoribosyltransferase [unclassified Kitasatospora]|uniref:anthranilate phosphoribosyltransferase n=1 Tax=unclassified Kitasatospora TaxID=2633591 RepID=UPI0033DFCE9B
MVGINQRTWPGLLTALLAGTDLDAADTSWAMDRVMRGQTGPAQLAGFLVALRAKGETARELAGLVACARSHAVALSVPGPVVDIVGTGGDGAHTVNVSTMSAIVAAAAGARVVKHGNRSASSASGSADVLEHLGVGLESSPEEVVRSVREVGIGFCFAPAFNPAFRHASAVRRELAVPTVFNALGPLTNPADPGALAVGVADPRLGPLIAEFLAERGVSALVFRGDDGLDELTVTGSSTIWSTHGGQVECERLDPRRLGIALADRGALRGGDAAHNAAVARSVLGGERGPVRDAVLLSAAAGLAALEPSHQPVADRLAATLARAAEVVDSGAAAALLDHWVTVSAPRTTVS